MKTVKAGIPSNTATEFGKWLSSTPSILAALTIVAVVIAMRFPELVREWGKTRNQRLKIKNKNKRILEKHKNQIKAQKNSNKTNDHLIGRQVKPRKKTFPRQYQRSKKKK